MNQTRKKGKQIQNQQDFTKKLIIAAAMAAHEVNRAYCRFLGDESHVPWKEAPEWQRESCIAGAISILENPSLTPQQSHAIWSAHKTNDGWVYGETKDAEKKTHPCLVEYDKLPHDQRVKDVLFGAVVRAAMGLSQ